MELKEESSLNLSKFRQISKALNNRGFAKLMVKKEMVFSPNGAYQEDVHKKLIRPLLRSVEPHSTEDDYSKQNQNIKMSRQFAFDSENGKKKMARLRSQFRKNIYAHHEFNPALENVAGKEKLEGAYKKNVRAECEDLYSLLYKNSEKSKNEKCPKPLFTSLRSSLETKELKSVTLSPKSKIKKLTPIEKLYESFSSKFDSLPLEVDGTQKKWQISRV